jgi:hypothetical protein
MKGRLMMNKKQYEDLKAAGTCTQCKKKKALKNRVKCGTCLYDDRQYRRAKREMRQEYRLVGNGGNSNE